MFELRGITKNFGSFEALQAVDFHARAGEIVGLLGENGAGKSTLLAIASGNLAPTSGTIHWRNEPMQLASARDATRLGIGIVHQHFKLVPNFTVTENIALHAARSGFVFHDKIWSKRIADWAKQLEWRIDPAKKIEELSVGERQRVEILKALFVHEGEQTAQLLLLDEPTANLTPGEVEELFGVLRKLRAEGRAIVFVSHKLKEVLSLCDRVTVLRGGRVVGERETKNSSTTELAELMVGRTLIADEKTHKTAADFGETCLEIKNLSCGVLRDFSIEVKRGEIVGIAGVDGNGQAELSEVLGGLRTPTNGTIQAFSAEPFASIPPDRQVVGLIPAFSLTENLALHPSLRRECKSILSFDWNLAKKRTLELMEKFDVRTPQSQENTRASQLSGGNQQKLVIARALSFPHSVVIAADPTRGLDVAAAQFVHTQLSKAAAEGAGVLLISTDLDEIFALSDRIGVLYEGQLLPHGDLLTNSARREEVGALMGGIEVHD